jgi:hypothetical protein
MEPSYNLAGKYVEDPEKLFDELLQRHEKALYLQ